MASKGDNQLPRGKFVEPPLGAAVVEDVVVEERLRGPRGPPGLQGPPGKDGKDGKSAKEGTSDTIYVPIFARIPDVDSATINTVGDSGVASGANPLAANWMEDSTTGDEVWLGPNPSSSPDEKFYFSYNNALIAGDSITGALSEPYPGERRPKGYRIGNLTDEPDVRDFERKADEVFYFDYRASLHRVKNRPTDENKDIVADEGLYDYYLNFEAFQLPFRGDPKAPSEDKPFVNFTHLVKNEWALLEDLSKPPMPDEESDEREPFRDQPNPVDLDPQKTEFRAHINNEYRLVLISTQIPSSTSIHATTTLTGGTPPTGATTLVTQVGANPVILTHSVDIHRPGLDTATDEKAQDSYKVRVLPRSWLQAYIGIRQPRRTTLTYTATVNACVKGTQALLQSVNCAGQNPARGNLTLTLDEGCDLAGFNTRPPDTLCMNYAMVPARYQGELYPGITCCLPNESKLGETLLRGTNCIGQVINGQMMWEDENPCGLVTLGNNVGLVGFGTTLYNSNCEWNPRDVLTEDLAIRVKIEYIDPPTKHYQRHHHRNTGKVTLSRGVRGGRGGWGTFGR